jgi:hypothetical protein
MPFVLEPNYLPAAARPANFILSQIGQSGWRFTLRRTPVNFFSLGEKPIQLHHAHENTRTSYETW